MAKVNFSEALRLEYENLYNTMEINVSRLGIVETNINDILKNKAYYEDVGNSLEIPWFFIAAIHSMESNRNFKAHLHNGDPLSARTRQVPKGRPLKGTPPFTWEESALDALTMKGLDKISEWNLGRILYELENYNGWGYRLYHQHVLTPYLWSFSNHYKSGKYVADGRWSDTAVSQQIGAAVLIRRLEERHEINPFAVLTKKKEPFFVHSNKVIPRAEDLQRFLNTFDGITLLVDGKPGNKTSEAVEKLFGFKLKNTPE